MQYQKKKDNKIKKSTPSAHPTLECEQFSPLTQKQPPQELVMCNAPVIKQWEDVKDQGMEWGGGWEVALEMSSLLPLGKPVPLSELVQKYPPTPRNAPSHSLHGSSLWWGVIAYFWQSPDGSAWSAWVGGEKSAANAMASVFVLFILKLFSKPKQQPVRQGVSAWDSL